MDGEGIDESVNGSRWKKQLSNRSRNEALKFLIDFSGATSGRGAEFNYSQY